MRWLGIGMQVVGGILLVDVGRGITGFAIAETIISTGQGILGLVFLLGGLGITIWNHRTYETYEPHVREALGDARYEQLSEREQTGAMKAYRRHENKLEKTAQYYARQEAKEKKPVFQLIRTEAFEDAIKKHPKERIQKALAKLEQGAMNLDAERMLGGPLKGYYRTKLTSKEALVYDCDARKNTITLIGFTSKHDYRSVARKLGKA